MNKEFKIIVLNEVQQPIGHHRQINKIRKTIMTKRRNLTEIEHKNKLVEILELKNTMNEMKK